jgi:hypothetical protein
MHWSQMSPSATAPNHRRPAAVADRLPEERRLLPARAAERARLLDEFPAGDALGRVEHPKHALHSIPSGPIWNPCPRRPLTDRRARPAPPAGGAAGPATFLHDLAADEIEERLAEVNRRFTDIAVVTGHPAFWQARFPAAKVVADDDVLDLVPGGA